MDQQKVPRLHRRAVLIYLGTIVVPACVLLWLGIESFERQRAALETLRAEKLSALLRARTLQVAQTVFTGESHPIVKHTFTFEDGVVIRPALRAPLPLPLPAEFQGAERQEDLQRYDTALESYRRLFSSHPNKGLALSFVARCLSHLGRQEEARAAWRKLADEYPDERDLSHRPFGIVAAIEAGDKVGLYEKIESGRWDLSEEYATHFLQLLDPQRHSTYLEQFQFARDLAAQFRPADNLREDQVNERTFGRHWVFYKPQGVGRISGFAADREWVDQHLRPTLEAELGIEDEARQQQLLYAAAIGVIFVILSAGVILLLRDVSRESRANRMRSDFVSSVSHELKTPITLIRLYSETLLRHIHFGESERDSFYRIIARESERLGRLVDQVLTFSRLERGDRTYNLAEGDLAPVIAAIVEDYREFLDTAGFSVERALPESSPPVKFDTAAIYQAVINLLDNAVKYSGASRDIAVKLEVAGSNVMFEVEDYGVGIPQAEQKKIFERFYRVANSSGKGGYGLGLYMVRHIMDAHGGRAEVQSEPGRGSRFRLVFPVVGQWAGNASS